MGLVKFDQFLKESEIIEEGNLKLNSILGGDLQQLIIEFSTSFKRGTLVLIPRSSKDLDALDQLSNVEDFLIRGINLKTGIKFESDSSYSGAGYGFKLNEDEILKKLK